MPLAERFNDGRRTKYKMQSQSITLAEKFLQEIQQRPNSKFMVGDIVYTENSYQEIQSKFYSPTSGWYYGFWTRRYSYNLAEAEITPLFFNIGDALVLPSGVVKPLTSISISSKGTLLLCFEVHSKQYTVYNYETILEANPPTDLELLTLVWNSFVKGQGNQTYCKNICEQINPLLAL